MGISHVVSLHRYPVKSMRVQLLTRFHFHFPGRSGRGPIVALINRDAKDPYRKSPSIDTPHSRA